MKNQIASTLKSLLILLLALGTLPVGAQDRLKTLPGYEQYQKMSREAATAFKSGALQVAWRDGGQALEYRKDGKTWRYDIATKQLAEATGSTGAAPPQFGRRGAGGGPERGRQFDSAASPDGKLKAFYRDRNLYLSDANGGNETTLTTDGSEQKR